MTALANTLDRLAHDLRYRADAIASAIRSHAAQLEREASRLRQESTGHRSVRAPFWTDQWLEWHPDDPVPEWDTYGDDDPRHDCFLRWEAERRSRRPGEALADLVERQLQQHGPLTTMELAEALGFLWGRDEIGATCRRHPDRFRRAGSFQDGDARFAVWGLTS